MPYRDAEKQREAQRRLMARKRVPREPSEDVNPVKAEGSQERRWNVNPGEPPKGYDPSVDGIDGWHRDQRPYVLQRSFGSGSIRSYAPAPANFSYYQELPYARPDAVRLFKGDIGRVLNG